MSMNIGVFSLQQFHNLLQNLGINNITGEHRPRDIHGTILISLGEPISNVTLGNGVETYPGGFPRFSINRHNDNLKLRFDPEHVDWWAGPYGPSEPNVDGLEEGEFNLIYDDNRTPIGVKLDDENYDNWLYFIELEDNISPHDPDEFNNARYGMEARSYMSSNSEEKRGESDNPAAVFPGPDQLPWWAGGRRRKKRTKKKSRKTRKKRKKKTKKRRKKRNRKKRKTRR